MSQNYSKVFIAMDNQTAGEHKECANCGVTDTPLWRKYNDHDLCNACGIYYRVNGFHRPFLPNMRKLLSSARKMGLTCINCGTKTTSMWRRTPNGESICNACGLYFRLNGVKRPVSMRKDWIRKRQRKPQQITGIMRLANQNSINSNNTNHLFNSDRNNVNNNNFDDYSHQNESLLTPVPPVNQPKSWTLSHSCYGHCCYGQELVNDEHQNELDFNLNNHTNTNSNSELTPFNDIKIDSFAASDERN